MFVYLPMDYPFKSPSVGFRTRVFHPNIDERSGTVRDTSPGCVASLRYRRTGSPRLAPDDRAAQVCLDVLNAQWSPMYELRNVFDAFLPQLVRRRRRHLPYLTVPPLCCVPREFCELGSSTT